VTAERFCHCESSTAAAEGIQYRATGRTAGQNAGSHEVFGECREVGFRVRLGWNCPDRTLVPKSGRKRRVLLWAIATSRNTIMTTRFRTPTGRPFLCFGINTVSTFVSRSGHRLVVPFRLGKEKHVFMCPRGTVRYALGHWVRLVPDHIRSQIPTGGLKSKRNPPGDTD